MRRDAAVASSGVNGVSDDTIAGLRDMTDNICVMWDFIAYTIAHSQLPDIANDITIIYNN
jgi:hypothetical protein